MVLEANNWAKDVDKEIIYCIYNPKRLIPTQGTGIAELRKLRPAEFPQLYPLSLCVKARNPSARLSPLLPPI